MALTVSRKQRLRKLENEIRSGLEEFYYTGMKLKEIRDDELYKEDGFGTWEKYCRVRWEYSRAHAHKLITASEYRAKLPALPTGQQKWSERSVRELTRIPDKKQAAKVAAKVIKEVEQKAKTDPKAKLTSTVVKRFVDEDLGVKKEKPTPPPPKPDTTLADYLRSKIGTIEGITENLSEVPADGWTLLETSHPQLATRLVTACGELAELLRS